MLTNLSSLLGMVHPVLVIFGVNVRVEYLFGLAISIVFMVIVTVLLLSPRTFGRSSEVA